VAIKTGCGGNFIISVWPSHNQNWNSQDWDLVVLDLRLRTKDCCSRQTQTVKIISSILQAFLLCGTEHMINDDCLHNKKEGYQNCSMLYCILHLCLACVLYTSWWEILWECQQWQAACISVDQALTRVVFVLFYQMFVDIMPPFVFNNSHILPLSMTKTSKFDPQNGLILWYTLCIFGMYQWKDSV